MCNQSNDDAEGLRREIDDFLRSNNVSLSDNRTERLENALKRYRDAENELKKQEEILKKEIIRYFIEKEN